MRGALQYDDVYELTLYEKQCMSEFLEKRLKAESKKPAFMNKVY